MDHFKRSLFSNHPEWDLRRIQEDRSGPFSWDIKVTFKAILKRSLKKQRNDSNCDGKFCEGFQNGIWNVSNDPYGTLKEFLIMIFEGFLQNEIRSLNDPSKKIENISSEIVWKISKRIWNVSDDPYGTLPIALGFLKDFFFANWNDPENWIWIFPMNYWKYFKNLSIDFWRISKRDLMGICHTRIWSRRIFNYVEWIFFWRFSWIISNVSVRFFDVFQFDIFQQVASF